MSLVIGHWALGIGDWGLGIGHWALGIGKEKADRAACRREGKSSSILNFEF
ncbi:MAG: hypothetical protein V7K62_20745 [Nostoc sp.]